MRAGYPKRMIIGVMILSTTPAEIVKTLGQPARWLSAFLVAGVAFALRPGAPLCD